VSACSVSAPSDEDSASPSIEDVQQKWDELASKYGCAPQRIVPARMPANCTGLAIALIKCFGSHANHCQCESDNRDLNCEGAYKPNEGPALCIDANAAWRKCVDQAPKTADASTP